MRLTRRAAVTTLALVSSVALAACGSTASDTSTADGADSAVSGEVTVFAAASLQKAYEELALAFTETNPAASVSFDFQGSQDLVAALAEGSSADVLATASTSTMQAAADQGLVEEQTEFATNVLTLIVPVGNPAGVTGLDASLEGADLVICAAAVPCGEATARLAAELGVTLTPVSEEQKVTDVRGKVESGEADAGIVYTTDAAAAGAAVESIALPTSSVMNHYPIAVTSQAKNATAAQAFVDLVLSEAGQEVLASYGFGAPAAK
ncbi:MULTISPECIES: molybdate ABC transporter substrate-binding protein [unclassified Actinomyces]|uniref:molybdate ABC transporter substrate-binding protein n=1 Tax=unclassified Actinomyces TaxID=2609248 RepID=UPI002017CE6D|nr:MULTISPECIES: molybdate ABC transporter substrate-binding protein [unclassified Actinomyces]MCL3778509.1 molybdate ABC transporter substrate-binding protein [Actinomyces sp. AC-20-1]MCL3790143.1 molybdate ABC transporter substrate-binding protein [Actinomyces sp. 187325]MCL3792349.1 molybdate ABC transporter substrate-binding protein [Actinomyces sp. 186855]MCL3794934.1 molybdate ABC transporter substrate-binding protein [Actinomyces sp. 217892]